MAEAYRIYFERTGGPEVLQVERIARPKPGPGEVLMRAEAIGLNFIDTYHRSGLYPVPLPSGLGSEAAGVVEAVGEDVPGLREGDRVGIFSGPLGAYATHRTVPAERLVKLPDAVDFETAASLMLKGCTAEFLIERCARVTRGESVLVHAAAGGVGSILVPWLKSVGAIVIAHVGTSAKAEQVAASGADHVLACPLEELAAAVRTLTDGRGVQLVLDGVGAASWPASIGAVARRGLLVSYGNASGPVPPFTAMDLVKAGSIFVTRPSLQDYVATGEELRASAARLFEMVADCVVTAQIGSRYPLSEAPEAHRALEGRRTTGSTLLLP